MSAGGGEDMPLSRGLLWERMDLSLDRLMEDKARDDSEHEATEEFSVLGRKVQRAFLKRVEE